MHKQTCNVEKFFPKYITHTQDNYYHRIHTKRPNGPDRQIQKQTHTHTQEWQNEMPTKIGTLAKHNNNVNGEKKNKRDSTIL
mgnify:CR=1 FL=1